MPESLLLPVIQYDSRGSDHRKNAVLWWLVMVDDGAYSHDYDSYFFCSYIIMVTIQ